MLNHKQQELVEACNSHPRYKGEDCERTYAAIAKATGSRQPTAWQVLEVLVPIVRTLARKEGKK